MPLAPDNKTIIPSLDPNDYTEESIKEQLKRLEDELLSNYKPLDGKCPVPIEVAIPQAMAEEFAEDVCNTPDSPKAANPKIPEIVITDYSKCINEGISVIKEVGKSVMDETQKLADLKDLLAKITEWKNNMEPIYKYHAARYKASNKKIATIIEPATKSATLATLKATTGPAFIVSYALFSTNTIITVSPANTIQASSHLQWFDDISKSEYLNDAEKSLFTSKIGILYTTSKYKNKINSKGKLYKEFYNLMEDPVTNFFSVSERGLVKSEKDAYDKGSMDELSVDTGKYIEVDVNDKTYYVGDDINKDSSGKTMYQKYISFYQDLFLKEYDSRVEKKLDELKDSKLYKALISEAIAIGKTEGLCYNNFSIQNKNSKKFVDKYNEVKKLIFKLKKEIAEITQRMSKDAITDDLDNKISEQSEECKKLFTIDKGSTDAPDNSNLDGEAIYSNPFGGDPSLPDYTKFCYWLKFCEHATVYNASLPYPDLENPKSLRYWPVGITIPAPSGLIKIPFPTVFVPLMVLSLPVGTFVLIFAQTGLFPALDLLFIANDGSKNFMMAASVSAFTSGKWGTGTPNFGFTMESQVDLLSLFPAEKIFVRPILNIADLLEAKKRLLEDKINEKLSDYELATMAYVEQNGTSGYDIMAQINKWRSSIVTKIVMAKDYSFGYELKDLSSVRKDLKNYLLNEIDWPVYYFPFEMEVVTPEPIIQNLINGIQGLLKMKLITIEVPMTLRDFVKEKIYEFYNNEEFRAIVEKIPERIDLSDYFLDKIENMENKAAARKEEKLANMTERKQKAIDDFNKLKAFFHDSVEWLMEHVDPNIWMDPKIQKYMDYLSLINFMHPFDCNYETDFEFPDFLNIFLLFVSVFDQAMETFTIENLKELVGEANLDIPRDKAFSILINFVLNYIPEIPLVDLSGTFDAIGANWEKIIEQTVKTFAPISGLTFDGAKDILIGEIQKRFGIPIEVDTKVFVTPLVNAFMHELDIYLSIYEQYRTMEFSTSVLKGILLKSVNTVFSVTSNTIKPFVDIYDSVIHIIDTIKAIREMDVEVDPLEVSLNPVETPRKLTAKTAKAMAWKALKEALGLVNWVFDPTMIELAIKGLRAITPLNNYILVGSACAMGGDIAKTVIRTLHPISFEEDLPPYERLKLSNPLFVIFLDGFCNNAKTINGFCEDYLSPA